MRITVLSGGTGGVKLIQGLTKIINEENLYIIVNVADNMKLDYGYFAPDIDTVMYALAGILSEKYYGIKNDTFYTNKMLKEYGYEEFLRIGDKDRASHIFKYVMMKRGYKLCEIIEFQRKALKVKANIIPASDDHIESRIVTNIGDLHLQEFWVKYKGMLDVLNLYIKGIENAKPCEKAIHAIRNSDVIIIGPSNPVSSILPILKLVGDEIKKKRHRCIAISPLLKDKPISGPAEKYMEAIGIEVSNKGLIYFYKDYVSYFVVDSSEDSTLEEYGRKYNVNVLKTKIYMQNEKDKVKLAKFIINIL